MSQINYIKAEDFPRELALKVVCFQVAGLETGETRIPVAKLGQCALLLNQWEVSAYVLFYAWVIGL